MLWNLLNTLCQLLLKPTKSFSCHTSGWPTDPKRSSFCFHPHFLPLLTLPLPTGLQHVCRSSKRQSYFTFCSFSLGNYFPVSLHGLLFTSCPACLKHIPQTQSPPSYPGYSSWALMPPRTYPLYLSWLSQRKCKFCKGEGLVSATFLGPRIKSGKTCISHVDKWIKLHTRAYLCLLFGCIVYISEGIKATAILSVALWYKLVSYLDTVFLPL